MSLSRKQTSWHWRLWADVCLEQNWTRELCDLDEKRHACYAQALGADKSLKDFTNKDFDRVVTLFKSLSGGADLNAHLAQASYARGEDPGERNRLLHTISLKTDQLGVAYMLNILQQMYHTGDLDDLTNDQLTNFRNTLNNRAHAKATRDAVSANPF